MSEHRPAARTVALIGGDGSGKSSVARALVQDPNLSFTAMYMGPSLTSASHLLPTSRLYLRLKRLASRGRPEPRPHPDTLESRDRPSTLPRLIARSGLQLSEVVHREVRVRRMLRRDRDVVFDRHILFEIWPVDEPANRVERVRNRYAKLLRRVCRAPDLTILLIADPETLLARKGETDVSYLARRNDEWMAMAQDDPSVVVVDAGQSLEAVCAQVVGMLDGPSHRESAFPEPDRPA